MVIGTLIGAGLAMCTLLDTDAFAQQANMFKDAHHQVYAPPDRLFEIGCGTEGCVSEGQWEALKGQHLGTRIALNPHIFDIPGKYDADLRIGSQGWLVVRKQVEVNGEVVTKLVLKEIKER